MEIGSILNKPKDSKKFTADTRWVLPKSLIGLEFEYEHVMDPAAFFYNDADLPNYWTVHKDDSLKDFGLEFVFKQPLFGSDAYAALQLLMTKAKEAQLRCTLRAGIHVHLDVRDMETSQLIGLIILYTIFEPVLFKWIGDNRENSVYCIPFYKADESLAQACDLVRCVLFDEKSLSKNKLTFGSSKKFARYAALNLNALHKFGSIEFRHMKTTHDFQRVVDWINIIQSLKAATNKLPTSDGAIIRLARNTAPNAFMEYVFGTELAHKLWVPEVPQLIQEIGVPTARDLVMHGLSQHLFVELQAPDGESPGFAKYKERMKAEPPKMPQIPDKMKKKYAAYQAAYEMPQLVPDDMVPPGLFAQAQAQQQGAQLNHAQWTAQLNQYIQQEEGNQYQPQAMIEDEDEAP